jgi:putative heme-binding domain-containing protein
MSVHRIVVCSLSLGVLLAGSGRAAEREATPPESISVRDGFQVQLLRSAQEGEGSWISMTFDPQGRIIVGIDQQGLGRLTLSEEHDAAEFELLEGTEDLRHCRGVLYAFDSLYVSATNSNALYRLRDTDGDGQFDELELLTEMDYRSRYGHGANQIIPGPDGMLYIAVGNDVTFPEGTDPNAPYRDPQNDWLLPSPHDLGQDNRVGYILRFDPAGEEWTVLAGGLRNQFDIAFNRDGELFTWDADMEWDAGLPWYRPTRINHLVSGGEYGWRWGTGKWPAWYPDSLPTTLDTGYGSPTGMVFSYESFSASDSLSSTIPEHKWPERYREALFMADWQNGRILLTDLIPHGASYRAETELFLEGGPLNVCDLRFGPDGALYFITGGRGSQSGLYRVTMTSEKEAATAEQNSSVEEREGAVEAGRQARQTRHRLEEYHVAEDREALEFIWEHLGSEDVWLRFAARVALENQPVEWWRERVASSPDGPARRSGLMALARVGTEEDQPVILEALLEIDFHALNHDDLLLPLRTAQLAFIRQGRPGEAAAAPLLEKLDRLYPHESFPANWLLGELLVYLKAPATIDRTLGLLEQAATQEEQVQYAKTLTQAEEGWTLESRRRMLGWLYRSRKLPGGKLVDATMRNLRSDFEQSLAAEERQQLESELAKLDEPIPDETASSLPPRPLVRRWTIEDLIDDVVRIQPEEHSVEAGRQALAAANCLRCHRIGDRGGQIGPDLTQVGKRYDGRKLLESILEPSKSVDPKYLHVVYLLRDGRVVTGRPIGVNRNQLTIETDPLTGRSVSVPREEIEESHPSRTSPMPQGLLDTLTREEILDLIALLRR